VTTRVLVVDDQEEITRLLGLQLKSAGYETRIVNDGSLAVANAKEWQPDLILLDIMMPEVDGYQVCQEIRGNASTTHIPVIMLTAKIGIDDKTKGFSVGANDYITKPHDTQELVIRISAHIQRTNALLALSNNTDILISHRFLQGTVPALHKPVKNPRVSVIVPTLNEAECIPEVFPRIPKWVDEVVLVDGYSTDDTVKLAQELIPDIRVFYQPGKGKGDALRYGFEQASGDIVVALDADGSTDPAEIPAFVGTLLAGADYAKGTRFLQGAGTTDMPLYRKIGNMLFVTVVRVLFGGRYSDLLYGYNAFWKSVLPYLELEADGFEIETEMNIRALVSGLKIAEVASFEAERIGGLAKLKAFQDGMEVLKQLLKEYLRKSMKSRVKRTSQIVEPS
jgi:CheY-like chemotaxis protein